MYMVGAASFLSLRGSCLSHQRHHPKTKTESTKRHRKYPDTPDEYHLKNDHETLPPNQPFNNHANQLTAGGEAQQKSSLCSVKQENVEE
ncbi:hypothetical protein AAG906_032735 [Vitis piasezkii]